MHAVFMTFEFSGGSDELTKALRGFADTLNEANGLVMNTWMRDGSTVGGFHVFRTNEAADRFLKGGRMRALTANFHVSNMYVQVFSTLTNMVVPRIGTDFVTQTADGIAGDDAALWQGEHVSIVASGD